MVVLLKTFQVILALSILIIVHEFGHFAFAKMFGIRVDKFYLFFDIGGTRLFSTKHNKFIQKHFPKLASAETDYGIGWLPLGGYCKICGMVDESMDTEQLKSEVQEWEYRSKPAWQRLLVVSGGILNNFILAIVLYIGILAAWGENYISNDGSQIYVNDLAYEMGFRNGDHIISYDDYTPENFSMLQVDLARQTAHKVKLLRGNDTISLYIDQAMMGKVLDTPGMFSLAIPFVVDSIPETSHNYNSGLLKGDKIIAVDSCETQFLQDTKIVFSLNKGKTVSTTIVRDLDSLSLELQVDTSGMVGIYTAFPEGLLQTKEYTVAEAVPAGIKHTFNTVGGYLQDLKLVATPSTEAYKSVGSFIAIGQVFPNSWDWYSFLNILALLSIMLGVMNLIPIPALDGGHMAITIFEMTTGRKPGDKFLMAAQMVGMIILIGLMVLAFGNDITRLFR